MIKSRTFQLMLMFKDCDVYWPGMVHLLGLFIKKIEKDKSDDTLAYEDNAHKVVLRTFSYFLRIVTHIGQG